jgi:dTDP-4-dehydrorhamnose reductase
MDRLLITGAHGMLGSALKDSLKNDFDVIAASREELNIESFADTRAYISRIQPRIIMHCAAYTNVEEAEKQPASCYRINYNGTLHLANAGRDLDAKFVYISSTGCYGAYQNSPYSEFDDVVPTTVYHKSKIAGENVVKELCNNFLVLRTGWLFGGDVMHKKNFVYNRFKEAQSKDRITSDPFQSGNPTNTDDVARQVKRMLREDISGIYNVVSEGHCTRFEYVKAIVSYFKLDCEVVPAEKPFERLAKVSPNEAAFNFNLTQMGLNEMPHWEESLKKYINSIQS